MSPFADIPTWAGWLLLAGAGLFGLFLAAALVASLVILGRAARARSRQRRRPPLAAAAKRPSGRTPGRTPPAHRDVRKIARPSRGPGD